jgi:tRNA(adenine34) deaminase
VAPKKKRRKWAQKFKTVSTFSPAGTFKKDAKSVARIMASKKVSPKGLGSGIRMLSMYINRAGKKLDSAQKKELERAKHILQRKNSKKSAKRQKRKTKK